MTTFTTSLDKFNKITTIIVFTLFAGICIFSYFSNVENEPGIFQYVPISLLIVSVIVYLIRPNNYSVSSDKLLIHRAIFNVEIDRNNIQTVHEIEESQLKNSIRTFGVGGFFGSFGRFWNGQLGKMTWYITRRNNFVLVETKDQKKIILTPDEPQKFVASFQ